jgi:hypothetical protein
VGRGNGKNKKPDSGESGLAVSVSGFFSRVAQELRMTIVAKPTRASARVYRPSW